jgi:5-methylcytosine-specific restriction enzyme subunit McrC
MNSRYLTAFEHQRIAVNDVPAVDTLTPLEADQLSLVGELRPRFCERGYGDLKLAQYCGVVSMGGRMLEVLPKTEQESSPDDCRGMLIRLLRDASHVPVFKHLPASQRLQRDPLLEVFIAAFLGDVAQVVRGGLLRQYREQEEDLLVVRGAIHFARQFTANANRRDRLACRFDELTADNVWNQSVRAGIWAVKPWIANAPLYRQWSELAAVFDEVHTTSVTWQSLDRLVFSRQAERYRAAIEWVQWIVRLLSPGLRAGANPAPGLLFDMNVLFQEAVAGALRRRAELEDVEVETLAGEQHLAFVSGPAKRRAFRLKPDLVLRRGRKVVAIGDTKWKRLEVGASGTLVPDQDDLYQMLAYAAAYQCADLVLIYPWHSGLAGSAETRFELPPIGDLRPAVSIVCVDMRSRAMDAIRGADSAGWSSLLRRESVA